MREETIIFGRLPDPKQKRPLLLFLFMYFLMKIICRDQKPDYDRMFSLEKIFLGKNSKIDINFFIFQKMI